MTTTDVFQGLQGGKNSSRVLAAPGGQSSISFGDPDESRTRQSAGRRNEESTEQDAHFGKRPGGQSHNSHSTIFGEEKNIESPDSAKSKKPTKGSGEESSSDSEDELNNNKNKPSGPARVLAKPPRGRYNPNTGEGQCSGYNPVTGEDYDSHEKVSPRQQKYANDQTRDRDNLQSTYSGGYAVQDHPTSATKNYKNTQTRGAYNPITGELYDDTPKPVTDSAKPSSNKPRGYSVSNPILGSNTVSRSDIPHYGRQRQDRSRGDFNPITGEAYKPNKEVHTSTRVRQPPGGASSKLW